MLFLFAVLNDLQQQDHEEDDRDPDRRQGINLWRDDTAQQAIDIDRQGRGAGSVGEEGDHKIIK